MSGKVFLKAYATIGPLGYMRAPGTIATLVTILGLLIFPYTQTFLYLLFLAFLWCCFHLLLTTVLPYFDREDPSEIVIDEVLGTLVTFYAIPISMSSCIIGFLLFRFFDISKWGPVGWAEKRKGSSGVLLDDVVAGLISNLLLRLFFYVV